MKIAHLPFGYYPDSVGGTEVYVRALALEQKRAGHQPFIVAPADKPGSYVHDGITVHRFRVDPGVEDVAELYDARTSVDAAGFARILDAETPDVLHVHGYGRVVSQLLLEAAQQRGVRIVFTYHTPTATCMRGTLLRWGTVQCDGRLDAGRCAACMLQSRGVPRVAAEIVGRLPVSPAPWLGGRVGTALRMRELVQLRHNSIRSFLAQTHSIVATADWVLELLGTLGVPSTKVFVSRQGTTEATPAAPVADRSGPLRVAFFGRIDRTKGIDVLLAALALAPTLPIELGIYGVTRVGDAYASGLLRRTLGDARVQWHATVPQDSVLDTMREYDAVVVPSQWLETGPLVVLEAFAAGVPVIGARLGGIAELVRDQVDGVLVEPANPRAWAEALRSLANDRGRLERLRAGVRQPRTMATVAKEMDLVYEAALAA